MDTWLITGISRGLGLALARCVLKNGDRVIGTVRGELPVLGHAEDRLHIIRCDLGDPMQISAMVAEAFEQFGSIDVIVNNAGYGFLGSLEATDDQELRNLFEVDVFAPIQIVREALPFLRARRKGHVINITSIAGRAPGAGASAYAAAKHALEGFSASVASELAACGISMTAIAPGQFRTEFLSSARVGKGSRNNDPIVETAMQRFQKINGRQLGDPERAAQAIVAVIKSGSPPLHLLLGSDALDRYKQKITDVQAEMAEWDHLSRSTDFSRPD
jgi:NAD(P)-dependent dehydrogenase (short-subunit alcohol dehydrogenase family)